MDAGPISGLEQVRTAPAEVGFAVRPAAEGFAVEDAAASRGQLSLWLAGSLDVRRSGSSVLVATTVRTPMACAPCSAAA